jgi:alpha-beta hydrolase superfamily lysophospholipase
MAPPDRPPPPQATRRLVVYVPGMSESADSWQELRDRLAAEPAQEDVRFETWDPRVRPWSRDRLADLANRLRVQLDTWWTVGEERAERPPFEEIILIGHSVGGLIVRHAYMLGQGWYEHVPARPWAAAVKRIVLLAAPNRGFTPQRLPWYAKALLGGVSRITSLLAEDVQAGSPYITDLRLRWIWKFNELPDVQQPSVVQLLGDRDSLVAREDSLDIEQFQAAAQVELPGTHTDLPRLQAAPDPEDRYLILRRAIVGQIQPTQPPNLPQEPGQGETVVFALHGIRTGNDSWEQLQQLLRKAAPAPLVIAPSYGYFSALSFALPFTRGRTQRFFLDLYSSHFARRRLSNFHLVGHSNGSYILGRALTQVPALRLNRVYLAGTVLPREYPWIDRFKDGQVQAVRVDRARTDISVGWLCAALRGLGMRDIGTAGVDGFNQVHERLSQFHYLPGGHRAALERQRLPGVAAFLLGQDNCPVGLVDMSAPFLAMSRVAPYAALAGVVGGGMVAARWVAAGPVPERLAVAAGALGLAWIAGHTV